MTKHFYSTSTAPVIVLQFNVINNIEEHKLSCISVDLAHPKASYKTLYQFPSSSCKYPTIAITPKMDKKFVTDTLKFKLKFNVHEVDDEGEEEGSYEDEYDLDKVGFSMGFREIWG